MCKAGMTCRPAGEGVCGWVWLQQRAGAAAVGTALRCRVTEFCASLTLAVSFLSIWQISESLSQVSIMLSLCMKRLEGLAASFLCL